MIRVTDEHNDPINLTLEEFSVYTRLGLEGWERMEKEFAVLEQDADSLVSFFNENFTFVAEVL